MRLRAPEGCGAVSHSGAAIEIGADGCVIVEDHDAQALLAHGFVLVSGREAQGAPLQTDASAENRDAPADDIDTLNRRGLFAFLKAKGVSVPLPVTNDELRALARRVTKGSQ